MTGYVVIGDGAAGTTAAQYIRRRDPDGRITIYSDDPNAAYYRAALTNYLIGELREDQLFAVPPDFYARNRIARVHARVAAIDTANHRLVLARGGAPVAYDRLCIATGSSPNPPPFAGAELSGVMTMRTLQDARAFMEDLRSGRVKRAVVVGGGPLALEWAQGLRARGADVTYVLRGREFMGGVLDPTGSDLVASRLRAFGCDLRMDEEVAEVIGDDQGRVRAVQLKHGGQRVECQLVCAAIGIRMNTAFLEASGIEVARGIPVDDSMRTNMPDVYAAGDVAEVYDPLIGARRALGLWEPARLQGRVAGSNMGGGQAAYRVGVRYNATRLYDLDFAGIGRTIESNGERVVSDLPKGKGTIAYRKLVIEDGRLVGALLLGHRSERVRRHGLRLQTLIANGTDVSDVAEELLDPAFDLPAWMAAERGEELRATRHVELGGAVPTYSRLFRMPDLASPLSRAIEGPSGAAVAAPALLPEPPQPAPAGVAVLEPPAPVGAGPGSRATLSVRGGLDLELGERATIGRAADSDLAIADPLVSGRHAEVRRLGDGHVLADAGSRNGTFLNDRPVMEPTPLADGDVIRLGDTAITFTAPTPRTPPVSAAAPALPGPVGAAVSGLFMTPDALDVPPPPAPRVLGVLEGAGKRFELLATAIVIGRDPSSDVALDDPAVSGIHAQVAEHDGSLYLRDLGSRNGTFVNRALVSVAHPLAEGDLIHVGDTDLTFRAGVPDPAPAATPPPVIPPAVVPPGAISETPAVQERLPRDGEFRLVVSSGPLVGLAFKLTPPGVIVGRDPESDVALSESTVSWRHARLTPHGAAWTIADLGSTNGTDVDGVRIEPDREIPIDPGADVRLGEIVLRFERVP